MVENTPVYVSEEMNDEKSSGWADCVWVNATQGNESETNGRHIRAILLIYC